MTRDVVAFASLFLGLVVGPQEIEVLVGNEVAGIELLLDGRIVAEIADAPWRVTCDLGERLEPKRLEAVAYDDAGVELGRTRQWLNLPHPPADVQLLLTEGEDGVMTAHLSWESVESETPKSVRASFDGIEIPALDPSSITLPPHDPKQLHYLKVEVQFSDNLSRVVERTFGGAFTGTVNSELTAVPLRLDKGVRPPARGGWLEANGQTLDVIDVVSGPAAVVLVRDQATQTALDKIARKSRDSFRWAAPLKKDYSLQFLRPVAERRIRTGVDIQLFAPRILSPSDGGLMWWLTRARDPRVPDPMQRLSDAVAVAGVNISASGHRRAVVLLVGEDAADHSRHSAESVRTYLRSLRVPLLVWSTAGAIETPWGAAADVSTLARLERETRRLTKHLESQRIVWVEGDFQPPEVSLAAELPGVRLAGS